MKTTARHTFRLAAVLGLAALLVTGMRCNGFTPGEPALPPQPPTYTYKTVLGQVEWPSKDAIDQTALVAIPAAERDKIKLSGVPVLVPKDPKFLANGKILDPDENGYDLGSVERVDGINFTIHGGRIGDASDAPVPPSAYEPDPDGIDIGEFKNVSFYQSESLTWNGTWGGYGQVGYLVSLHCQEPTDPRCADRSYLTEFIRSLVFVGGNFVPYKTTILDN